MSESTPVLNKLTSPPYKNSLSSSLKDRLKRCGRYHSSPSPSLMKKRSVEDSVQNNFSTPKKLKLEKFDETNFSAENDPEMYKSDTSFVSTPSTSDISTSSESVKANSSFSPDSFSKDNDNRKREELFTTPISIKSNKLRRSKLNLHRSPKLVNSELNESKITENTPDSIKDVNLKLSSAISEKEEKLRKLKMVKMYRKKNDLSKLEELIEKWRGVSQEAVQDLHRMLPEPKPSLYELIQHLQIDDKLIRYNPEDDSFD